MNANRTIPARQAVATLIMAATMTLGLLSMMGLIADRYHADEAIAQAATPVAQQAMRATRDSHS